jgi:hypothetical protein
LPWARAILLLIAAYRVHLKIGEMSAQSDQFGSLALGSLRQTIHVEVGFFTVIAPALVLAVQGLRYFLTKGRKSASTLANCVP